MTTETQNGNRERYWLDTLTDEERDRARRLMDMPIAMAIAFVDRDLRAQLAASRGRGFRERLYEFGFIGAWLAYVLFDNRDQLPPIGR